jgi:protein associated with RNAse G/E
MRPGDKVWVRVYKADGSLYRSWQALVESVSADCVVLTNKIHDLLYMGAQSFAMEHHFRSYFWPGRRHTLLEMYEPDGRLYELYADITAPIQLAGEEIHFIDHELDVSMMAGEEPRIVDQDEFAEAAVAYGYTEVFMRECYALAQELVTVLANWQPRGF